MEGDLLNNEVSPRTCGEEDVKEKAITIRDLLLRI